MDPLVVVLAQAGDLAQYRLAPVYQGVILGTGRNRSHLRHNVYP